MNELVLFATDTENPEKNYNLAEWYDNQGHNASAHTYYLRAAERAEDKLLAYTSLLRASISCRKQATREVTEKSLIHSALSILPERPEAYYFLCLIYEKKQEWDQVYTYSILGLNCYDKEIEPINIPEYEGKYLLVYQKAISSWWWGKMKESRDLFHSLVDEYWDDMNSQYRILVEDKIMHIGLGPNSQSAVYYDKSKLDQLRFKFKNSDTIERSYSQVLQDIFVLSALDGKNNGTFLEIGGAKPFDRNNTALLEEKFNWRGVSIELDETFAKEYTKERPKTKVLNQNALDINYEKLLNENFQETTIDYLQLDIEPARNTYECMLKIPFDKYKFAVITYEHDYYIDVTRSYRQKSRDFLKSKGYVLVVNDISPDGISSFEDWWVHPDLVDEKIISIMKDTNQNTKNAEDYIFCNKFYSEFETDKYLRENFFPDLGYKGIMVEVGAGPQEFISNSKHFRNYGWRTIAVEPNPKFVKQHRDSNSEVYQYACSNEEKETTFTINYNNDYWYSQENDGVSFSSLGIKYDNVPEHNTQEVIEVQTIKLNTLLDKIDVSSIDILSIDTEGWELEVMMGFDQEKYLPKVIVLENFQNNLNYEPFMNDRNYIKHSQLGYNEIYVREKLTLEEIEHKVSEVISNSPTAPEFDWGNLNEEYVQLFTNENFVHRTYEKHQEVKPNDIVFDVGANYGSFTYSILDKKPKEVYCIEPSNTVIDFLRKNVSHGPVTFINKAISDKEEISPIPENGVYINDHEGNLYSTTTFEKIIKEYNISKIDFLKFDCEGGEYSIFTKDNYEFIRNNVTNFAGEWHINDHQNAVERFIEFRNLYLNDCSDLHVYERNGKDVTKDIFNDQYPYDFRDWWKSTGLGQFMIYFSYGSTSKFDSMSNEKENKLTNFPPVYYISLKESKDRQDNIENQFKNYKIENYTPMIFNRFSKCSDIIHGPLVHTLDSSNKGASTSHLKSIKKWLTETDEPYAVFFEDDVSFKTVEYWNFDWNEFMNKLPKDWEAVQLMWVRPHMVKVELRERYPDDWSATAFMLTRPYGQKLLDRFMIGDEEFNYDMGSIQPIVENIMFTSGKVYTIPMFVEEINLETTSINSPEFNSNLIINGQNPSHHDSYYSVLTWWETTGRDKNLDELFYIGNKQDGKSMKIVQIGTNKANDDLSNYLLSNYNELEFGLFVDANSLHIDDIKNCYSKFNNIEIENVAIKTPLQNQNTLTIYYHTNEHPHYTIASCDIEHIKKHMTWCPHLEGGEIKSFEVACITLEELLEKHSIYEIDWLCLDIEGIDAEILLTFDWSKYRIKRVEFEHLHLGYYKSAIKNMMIGMGYDQIDSLNENDWAFENKNIVFETQKLKNFPSVNFVSIEESQERRDVLYEMFEKYGIQKVTPHIYKRYSDEDHKIIEGPLVNLNGKGPVTSHLKAIKEWYESTDEEYTLICEDDFSFDTVKYWNFTWQEFFEQLPQDWNLIQLCLIREDMFFFFNPEVKLRNRCWCDWSASAYLISRKHAENLIKNYYPDDFIHLEYKGTDKELREREDNSLFFCLPFAENIIYSPLEEVQGGIYTFPLFVENVSFNSTWSGRDDNWLNVQSRDEIMNWWETKGQNKDLNDLRL